MPWVLLSLVLSLWAAPAQQAAGPFEVEFKQVREGIYVASRPDPIRIPVEGNVTVIVTSRDVVVVDSGGAPASARQTVARIRELTGKPVGVLVNTHGHGDQTLGNQVYAESFPGLEIVMHPGTRNYMYSIGQRGLGYVENYKTEQGLQEMQRQGEAEVAQLEQTEDPAKEEIRAYLNQYYRKDLFARAAEYEKVKVTGPTMTVSDSLTLYRGDQEIRILHLGYGNTASDLAVYLPKEKVIITGDIVTLPVPYGFSRGPVQWLATLDKLSEFDFDILIPGHGEIQWDRTYVDSLRGLFHSIIEQVPQGIARGSSLEEIRKQVDFSPYREQFAAGNPLYRNRFDAWFAEPVVERIYDELTAGAGD